MHVSVYVCVRGGVLCRRVKSVLKIRSIVRGILKKRVKRDVKL